MDRCEGCYRPENRRCDRAGLRTLSAADGETYLVCEYHARHAWSASVARWHGDADMRSSAPASLGRGMDSAA